MGFEGGGGACCAAFGICLAFGLQLHTLRLSTDYFLNTSFELSPLHMSDDEDLTVGWTILAVIILSCVGFLNRVFGPGSGSTSRTTRHAKAIASYADEEEEEEEFFRELIIKESAFIPEHGETSQSLRARAIAEGEAARQAMRESKRAKRSGQRALERSHRDNAFRHQANMIECHQAASDLAFNGKPEIY